MYSEVAACLSISIECCFGVLTSSFLLSSASAYYSAFTFEMYFQGDIEIGIIIYLSIPDSYELLQLVGLFLVSPMKIWSIDFAECSSVFEALFGFIVIHLRLLRARYALLTHVIQYVYLNISFGSRCLLSHHQIHQYYQVLTLGT